MFVSGKELQTDGIGLCWVFLSVDCAVNKKVRSNLPWDFTKNEDFPWSFVPYWHQILRFWREYFRGLYFRALDRQI